MTLNPTGFNYSPPSQPPAIVAIVRYGLVKDFLAKVDSGAVTWGCIPCNITFDGKCDRGYFRDGQLPALSSMSP